MADVQHQLSLEALVAAFATQSDQEGAWAAHPLLAFRAPEASRAYDLAGILIDSQDFALAARFPVTISAAGVHRVEVDFTGAFGYSLDDLTYRDVAAVPEPATLILASAGLSALGALRHRRASR